MHKEEPGHRAEGLLQEGLVGGSVKGATGEGVSFSWTFSVAVVGETSKTSKD